jgi:glycosyltransferase involved in cell wall biosynthesis
MVSIVIPTYRRASLARTLRGLAVQEMGAGVEVIVVDNDRDGSASSIVSSYTDGIDAPLRHIVEPQSGSAYARNRGIAEARGSIIALLDDDVEPCPGWFQAITEPITSGRADATGGRVLLDPEVPRPKWLDENGIGGYITSFHLDDTERDLTEKEFVVTANAAFDADLLRRTGGFDPKFGPRGRVNLGGDDVHVVRTFRRLGGRVRYVPSAVVIHDLPKARMSPRYLLKRAWWVGQSDWVLDAETLGERRFGGARVALDWYGRELRRRRAEGLVSIPVLFHALCDFSRTAGSLVGAASLSRENRRSKGSPR